MAANAGFCSRARAPAAGLGAAVLVKPLNDCDWARKEEEELASELRSLTARE